MANLDLDNLVRPNVKSLKAYHVDNHDCKIKLHANENPFPLPTEILDLISCSFKNFQFNRYPDPGCQQLRKAISTATDIPAQNLVVGNGSDELLQLILQVFCEPGDGVAFPDPSFAMYSILAKSMDLKPVPFSLNDQWDFKADSFLEIAEQTKTKVVFFSFPNNPTGNCFSSEEIEKTLDNFQGIVVLDEAYYDFAQKTFKNRLETNNNLIVLRSLSKIGLAALRVGFAAASPLIVEELNKIRLPYNSNSVSQMVANEVLNQFHLIQKQIDLIIQERTHLFEELSKLNEIEVFPSDSNFLLFKTSQNSGEVFQKLAQKDILLRDLSSHPKLKNCLRVTIGTPDENSNFLQEIEKIL
jgi:histidinol-phosphate aminotransferase